MDKDNSNPTNELKRYDVIMAHLRYEHTVFWMRFGFMMITQILGFFVNVIFSTMGKPYSIGIPSRIPFCVLGILLVVLFYRLRNISDWWISHWISILEQIEPKAFGDFKLFREVNPPGSARNISTYFIYLFSIIWLLSILAIWII